MNGIINIIYKIKCRFLYVRSLDDFNKKDIIIVTFTGGLGAQLVSASIYFYLTSLGFEVYADLSYFKHFEDLKIKNPHISIWKWDLNGFGYEMQDFREVDELELWMLLRRVRLIVDGEFKTCLAYKSLNNESIRSKFCIPDSYQSTLKRLKFSSSQNYIAIHLRRGDYVTAGSHIIMDDVFIKMVLKLKSLNYPFLIFSDSPLTCEFISELSVYKINHRVFYNELSTIDIHCLMRNSDILVCSNSQFSLTAALLSNNISFFPTIVSNHKDILSIVVNKHSDFYTL